MTLTSKQAVRVFVVLSFCVLSLGATAAAHAAQKPARQAEEQLKFGVDMARRGLWSEALFRFRQASRLDPSNPRILNNLAVAYEATGEFEQALATYRRALELAPSDKETRRNYSRFIEFYQGYKPEGEGEAPAEGGGTQAGAEEPTQNQRGG